MIFDVLFGYFEYVALYNVVYSQLKFSFNHCQSQMILQTGEHHLLRKYPAENLTNYF